MTKAAAEALGVPIGTSATYATANRVKSGGGSSKNSSEATSAATLDDYISAYDQIRASGSDTTSAFNYIYNEMKADGASKEVTEQVREYMYDDPEDRIKANKTAK